MTDINHRVPCYEDAALTMPSPLPAARLVGACDGRYCRGYRRREAKTAPFLPVSCSSFVAAHPGKEPPCPVYHRMVTGEGIDEASVERAFLAPRGILNGKTLCHQGIDIYSGQGTSASAFVVSVTDGVVVDLLCRLDAYRDAFDGLGRWVLIKSARQPYRYYLYAHLHAVADGVAAGRAVRAGQLLGKTGCTLYRRAPDGTVVEFFDDRAPRLHFEVSSSPYPRPLRRTRTIDDRDERRFAVLDPIAHLASLGPFERERCYYPVPSSRAGGLLGYEVTDASTSRLRNRLSRTNGQQGGFPIGTGRFWHGGVHVSAPAGTRIRAPLAGDVVAVRLDDDGSAGRFGSTSFILLRHSMDPRVYAGFSGAAAGDAALPRAVFYSLFMHLPTGAGVTGAETRAQLVAEVPWLGRAAFSGPATGPGTGAAAVGALAGPLSEGNPSAPDETAAALIHEMTGRVGLVRDRAGRPAKAPRGTNRAVDVVWVKERLRELGYFDGPVNGVVDAALESAVAAFQRDHVPGLRRSGEREGRVARCGETVAALRRPRGVLERERAQRQPGPDPARPTPVMAADFAQALLARDEDDRAPVVSGMVCPVAAGEVLWLVGGGTALDPPGRTARKPDAVIHWEMFSETPLISEWPSLESERGQLVQPEDAIRLGLLAGTGGSRRLPNVWINQRLSETQVRLESSWGSDLGAFKRDLQRAGCEVPDLDADVLPYQWWHQAGDALPPSTAVWHYHPVAFLARYQRVVPAPELAIPLEAAAALSVEPAAPEIEGALAADPGVTVGWPVTFSVTRSPGDRGGAPVYEWRVTDAETQTRLVGPGDAVVLETAGRLTLDALPISAAGRGIVVSAEKRGGSERYVARFAPETAPLLAWAAAVVRAERAHPGLDAVGFVGALRAAVGLDDEKSDRLFGRVPAHACLVPGGDFTAADRDDLVRWMGPDAERSPGHGLADQLGATVSPRRILQGMAAGLCRDREADLTTWCSGGETFDNLFAATVAGELGTRAVLVNAGDAAPPTIGAEVGIAEALLYGDLDGFLLGHLLEAAGEVGVGETLQAYYGTRQTSDINVHKRCHAFGVLANALLADQVSRYAATYRFEIHGMAGAARDIAGESDAAYRAFREWLRRAHAAERARLQGGIEPLRPEGG